VLFRAFLISGSRSGVTAVLKFKWSASDSTRPDPRIKTWDTRQSTVGILDHGWKTLGLNRTSEFEFRESSPTAEEYLALFESTGWNQKFRLTAEELWDAVRQSWHLVVAYDHDRLVGTGRVISDGVFHAFIVDIIVLPEYQAKGLGTSIMERLLDRCRDGRIRHVQLFCARDKEQFYSRLGFVARPEGAPGMDYRPARPEHGH
jgi:GNAT superfamily N-acetyltransferase